jgi:hypothetical protein
LATFQDADGDTKIQLEESADEDKIRFDTAGTERMIISGSNVGIGTSSPTSDSGYSTLSLSNTTGGQVVFKDDGTTMAGILGNATNLGLTTVGNRYINFNTNGSERMRIDGSGNLMLGTTTSNSKFNMEYSSIFGQVLKYTGSNSNPFAVVFDYGSSTAGSITITSSATSFNTSSDYRLKENIDYEFDALARVKQLKPARFNFIVDADTTVDGFLAHEVSSIVPEAITGEKDAVDNEGNPEYQGIDQSKLVPLLTKAIQELTTKVEELEGKIE